MAYRDSPFQELRVPLTWAAAAAAVVAAGLAVLIFTSDRKDEAKSHGQALGHAQIRGAFDGAVAPATGVVAAPMRWIGDGFGSIGDYFFAVSENRRLKKRLAEMQQTQIDNIALRNLNRRYEDLLKLRTEPPIPMVTARVVSDVRGPFSNARLLDVGSDKGVKVGNPAMTDQGVVGRVVGVSPGASRLLLLTDPESRTPVLIDRTNARAVLTGDGGPNPRLDYLRGRDVVKSGDLVLTSGDGGLFPRGLPVGVAQQDIRGVWRVQLFSDRGNIDFAKVLVYDDFTQMVDQAKLTASALPPLAPSEAAQVKAAAEAKPTVKPPPAVPTASPGTPTAAPAATAAPAVPPGPAAATRPAPPSAKPTAPRPPAVPPTTAAPVKARATAAKPSTRLRPGEYRRVHTPDQPPIMDERYPQFDPNRPQGAGAGGGADR